jgi:hypothetical protein
MHPGAVQSATSTLLEAEGFFSQNPVDQEIRRHNSERRVVEKGAAQSSIATNSSPQAPIQPRNPHAITLPPFSSLLTTNDHSLTKLKVGTRCKIDHPVERFSYTKGKQHGITAVEVEYDEALAENERLKEHLRRIYEARSKGDGEMNEAVLRGWKDVRD